MKTKKLKKIGKFIWIILKKIRALVIYTYYIMRYGFEEGNRRIFERISRNIAKLSPEEREEYYKKLYGTDENDS
jgi:hypothetical protein